MKKILLSFLGIILLVLSGCSSVDSPKGVNQQLYKKWKIFSEKDEQQIYRNYNTKEMDKNFINDNRVNVINEKEVINYYRDNLNKINTILKKKTDYNTKGDLFKENEIEISKIDKNLQKIFVVPYSNNSQWDKNLSLYLDWITGKELHSSNISYDLNQKAYDIYIRFENSNIYKHTETQPMTNGFGAVVKVNKNFYVGDFLKASPNNIKIPLDVNIAKNYEIKDLVVDLYIKLDRIDKKDYTSPATYNIPIQTTDLRTLYRVKILGYRLRDKNTNKIIVSNSI